VTGGRVDSIGDAARRRGTTITVRGLFFNTPARRKFLRSVGSETRAIWDTVATLALAHPATGFEFLADGQQRLLVPSGQTRDERLASVWGRDLAGTLIPVQHAAGAFRVDGYVQRPGDAKPTGRRVQLFVNGRPFRDPFLVRAAEAGYRSALHPGDRPSVYLDIGIAPGEVDVNVHPAKLECGSGTGSVWSVASRTPCGTRLARSSPPHRSVNGARCLRVLRHHGSRLRRRDSLPPRTCSRKPALRSGQTVRRSGQSDEFAAPVWQLFSSYIAFQADDGLVMVDQHSAHERVLYERTMEQLRSGGAPSQRLLLPITLEMTDEELDAIEAHREDSSGSGSRSPRSVAEPWFCTRCPRRIRGSTPRRASGKW
jgi:DNA mismatch repair protein MutL